jgi:RimJ/RimL family protein N-acetyltransferase|tara:strand:+ start:1320 stop:1904 length:585 start_codon:yes stop_codon:yes gene_type:complete
MTKPSTIETERLLLRPFRGDDFEPMVGFYADPVSKFYGGPCSREEAWRKFAVYPGHWALRGYGPWAIEVKATGQFAGVCGLWNPDGWIEPEITWALVPNHHGMGYATEAARRAIQAAYEDHGWTTAASVIAVANVASAAVADRLGATIESEQQNRYGPVHVYRHLPPASPPPAPLPPAPLPLYGAHHDHSQQLD